MKQQTIAEWVEDAASTSLLFACGVDFVQGNFLQEPPRCSLAEYMPCRRTMCATSSRCRIGLRASYM